MTDAQTPSTQAGWYPDPSNAAQQRWWDGSKWTEQVSAPSVAAEQATAPAGTSGNTPWIWLNVFLPMLGLIPLFFIDFTGYIKRVVADPTDVSASLSIFFEPGYIVAIVLSLLIMVGTIVFAFLDYRELTRRGIPQPFHWAFAFLALAGFGIVYPIGRAVVTKRRTGSGNGVLVAVILTIVVSFIVAIVFTVILTQQALAFVG